MSTDGSYILNYETQGYIKHPKEFDKEVLLKEYNIEPYYEDDNIILISMNKYTIQGKILEKIKADRIFESLNGGVYSKIQ